MQRNEQYIQTWLASIALLIIAIISLGGYTRLAGAGLSIVTWDPITGILPPLTDWQWIEEFNKYKLSPEFRKVNYDIDLNSFKFLFMVEFLHRLLARVIGLASVLPLFYFYYAKIITKQQLPKYLLIVMILSLQGFVGWYMVKSGLIENPHVSHYRLGLHLIIAIGLYSFIFYQLIARPSAISVLPSKVKGLLKFGLILLYLQTFFGAMVAGLKAGLLYNTFPLMGQSIFPENLQLSNFNDPATLQFIHRMLAYIITIICFYISYLLYKTANAKTTAHASALQLDNQVYNRLNSTASKKLKQLANLIAASCLLQVGLGILTLLYMVPIAAALIHQFGAIVLISVLIYAYCC